MAKQHETTLQVSTSYGEATYAADLPDLMAIRELLMATGQPFTARLTRYGVVEFEIRRLIGGEVQTKWRPRGGTP